MRWLAATFLTIFLFASLAPTLLAQSLFEQLVTPGPLSKAHQEYKTSCNKCHVPFRQATQTLLCLDCHDKVAADLKSGEGFHSKNPVAAKRECRYCHTEHKGTDADIVGFDPDTFDHKQTDFLLEGRHTSLTCESCHKPKKPHRSASRRCIDCHRSDDPHKGRLGSDCQVCHNPNGWRKVKPFDHSKTEFPLVGSHATVSCAKCHSGEVYDGTPKKCVGCHSVQDIHSGDFGPNCKTCHSPDKWSKIHFDHNRDTKFPLRGTHKAAKCSSCHRGDIYTEKPPMKCSGCHGRQDPHKGALGKNCGQCHNEDGWRGQVAFDHDLTQFPLIGLHAVVGCDGCHRSKNFKEAPRRCAACHSDSFHRGRLGPDCARCHNPNSWERWAFDHSRDAGFQLTGAHHSLDCHACHRKPAPEHVTAPKSCYACHSADDAHHGAFGRECAKCHSTESFRDVSFRR